jgi:hypothetical protein
MNDKFTIGELLTALETNIFDINSSDGFISNCRKRENEIKRAIEICGIMMQHHIEKPGLTGKIAFWKREKIKDNILNIMIYTSELYHKLNRDAIEKHVKSQVNSFFPIIANEEPDLVFLMLHSYYGSILIDLNWIIDMPFQVALGLASGHMEVEEIGKLLPGRIEDLKHLLNTGQELKERYESSFYSIYELINCYEKKYNRAFNVLAVVTIESLVRQFGEYLIEKQELVVDLESDQYNSIDSFLRKIPWKDGIEYTKTAAKLWTSNSFKLKEKEEKEANPTVVEVASTDMWGRGVLLTYYERLGFLRRRFKENRDVILHGQEKLFDTDWQCYVNASALLEVLKTMKEFSKLYEKEDPC